MGTKEKLLDEDTGDDGLASRAAPSGSATEMSQSFNPEGLTDSDAARLLQKYGYNELTQETISPFMKFLTYFVGPIPFLMEAATIISFIVFVYEEAVQIPTDPATWIVLLFLLVLNGFMGWREETNAGNAIDALKAALAPQARVKRNGRWVELPAKELVPGDLVILKLGDIVPADSKLGEGQPMEVDQAALTGESLPVTVFPGDVVYSGSVIKRGELHATVYATGSNTFFGKAAQLVASVESRGHLQMVLLKIAYFLMSIGTVLVVVLFLIRVVAQHAFWVTALVQALVLLVASIPIAMQVVTTATMAVGARGLAEHKAIVARLASIEELAGMTILCSDKTGTLTKNKLTLDTPTTFYGTDEECIFASALCAKWEGQDAIDFCLTNAVPNQDHLKAHKQTDFIPFDPVIKRTESTILTPDGKKFRCTKGAPQVIADLAHNADEISDRVHDVIEEFGSRGYRAIGVAQTNDNDEWEFMGLIPLFDPPRDDTKQTIESALDLGVEVKMITGDHLTIAKETSRRLGMGTNIYTTEMITDPSKSEAQLMELAVTADGFAQVFPEHKFQIVELIQKTGRLCGMTGDGVNDAPALKKADVGIAVEGATDAARAAADIVLVEPGLSVIITALIKSREIFQRIKAYVIYRISATFQLLLFMFFSQILLKAKPQPIPKAGSSDFWTGFPYAPSHEAFVDGVYGAVWPYSVAGAAGEFVINPCKFPNPASSCGQNVTVSAVQLAGVTDFGAGIDELVFPPYTAYTDSQGQQSVPSSSLAKLKAKNGAFPEYSQDRYPRFTLPAIVLVIITILNDGTILSIAYDRVEASATPEKWRLSVVICICVILGGIGFAELMVVYAIIASSELSDTERSFSDNKIKPNSKHFPLTGGQVEAGMYFLLSMGGQRIVFCARTETGFFTRRPGNGLFCAFLVAQTISLLLSLFWPLGGSLESLALRRFTTSPGVSPGVTLPTQSLSGIKYVDGYKFFMPLIYVPDFDTPQPAFIKLDSKKNKVSACAGGRYYKEGYGQTPGKPLKCFLHSTDNAWLVGFLVLWAAAWFVGMDCAKVLSYIVIAKYYLDMEGDSMTVRRAQKRMSVAVESERRATMAGAQRRSMAARHQASKPAAAAGAPSTGEIGKLATRVTKVEKRVDALEKTVSELPSGGATATGSLLE
jgi:H+-transporting ATPase